MPVPKYCYEVERQWAIGQSGRSRDIKSFETLAAAVEYARSVQRIPNSKRIVVRVVLDEWTSITDEARQTARILGTR